MKFGKTQWTLPSIVNRHFSSCCFPIITNGGGSRHSSESNIINSTKEKIVSWTRNGKSLVVSCKHLQLIHVTEAATEHAATPFMLTY